jgi:hypothetical protein
VHRPLCVDVLTQILDARARNAHPASAPDRATLLDLASAFDALLASPSIDLDAVLNGDARERVSFDERVQKLLLRPTTSGRWRTDVAALVGKYSSVFDAIRCVAPPRPTVHVLAHPPLVATRGRCGSDALPVSRHAIATRR